MRSTATESAKRLFQKSFFIQKLYLFPASSNQVRRYLVGDLFEMLLWTFEIRAFIFKMKYLGK
jgi:hypothetical protein